MFIFINGAKGCASRPHKSQRPRLNEVQDKIRSGKMKKIHVYLLQKEIDRKNKIKTCIKTVLKIAAVIAILAGFIFII